MKHMQQNFTDEEKKDITERVDKAAAYLKELELACAVQMANVNLGAVDPKFNGIFGTYPQCFLQDQKYTKNQGNSVPSTNSEVNPTITDDIKDESAPAA